ncbi:MAG: beta-lactamase family protein [bacterium]|nr:beta-lactamase family protein [bacterium]
MFRFRPRPGALLILAALCWGGPVAVGQTQPTTAQAGSGPNRSPATPPRTTGSAASRPADSVQGLSRRQRLLPAGFADASTVDEPTKTEETTDNSTETQIDPAQKPEREEFDPAVERERRKSIQGYLDPLIKDLMNELRVPGAAIAIVRRNRVYMMQGYGFGDLTTKARIDAIRTRFPVGRVSANITAAAVLHAADRGLLQLNSPADSYLPRPLPRPRGRGLTIEDLLLRKTGLAAVSQNGGFESRAQAPALDEYIRRARPAFRQRDGGPSDYEISVLGRILEGQSRLSYAEHIRQFFFRPIGMNRSSFAYLNESAKIPDGRTAAAGADLEAPAGWARPYRYEFEQGSSQSNTSTGRFKKLPARYFAPAPALGLSTTAGDMARYLVMLLDRGRFGQARLLGEEAVQQMLDIRNEDRFLRPTYYYGFEAFAAYKTEAETASDRIAAQPAAQRALITKGDLPGYAAVLCVAPEKEFGVFLATNSHSPEFRDRVLHAFLDRFVFR